MILVFIIVIIYVLAFLRSGNKVTFQSIIIITVLNIIDSIETNFFFYYIILFQQRHPISSDHSDLPDNSYENKDDGPAKPLRNEIVFSFTRCFVYYYISNLLFYFQFYRHLA